MDERPSKRARQACEPCRRKKSRCPGERPVCSFCSRLGQTCHYNSDEAPISDTTKNRDMRLESRIDGLETKLDEVLQHLSSTQESPSKRTRSDARPPSNQSHLPSYHGTRSQGMLNEERTSANDSLYETGRLYLAWCHHRPIALFDANTFIDSLPTRDEALLLAIQALTIRFPPGSLTAQRQVKLAQMAAESRRLAMERVTNGTVDLCTLQTLCLLGVVSFMEGQPLRAGLDISIASYLVSLLQNGSAQSNSKEYYDVKRTIFHIKRLQSPVSMSLGPDTQISPGFPATSPPRFEHENQRERDILDYSYSFGDVWQRAREYAAARPIGKHQLPPWNPQSDYSSVMQHHLELDSSVPLKYRFAANKFSEQTLENLQRDTAYWAPWLFLQIAYAAIPCLLNHPFLLSMRLRDFRKTMPQMFIDHSFEHINRHAGWIIFFLDLIEKKGFEIVDPALAHSVVIVATIHLQHSFAEDATLQKKAKVGFEKCMRFLRNMGRTLPTVLIMAQNLQKLQDSITTVPVPESLNPGYSLPAQSWSINAQLLWDLLIYERAGREAAKPDQSIFAPSLRTTGERGSQSVDEPAAEFNLIGSAGISGHRSVPKGIPAYAPGERPVVREHDPPNTEMNLLADEGLFEIQDLINDQESAFLQSNDYERAIDDWLNFDAMP